MYVYYIIVTNSGMIRIVLQQKSTQNDENTYSMSIKRKKSIHTRTEKEKIRNGSFKIQLYWCWGFQMLAPLTVYMSICLIV